MINKELYTVTRDQVKRMVANKENFEYQLVTNFRNAIMRYESKDDLTALLSATHDLQMEYFSQELLAPDKLAKIEAKYNYEMAGLFYQVVVNQLKVASIY
jgi:phage host-nuclease inhibitor protein Gam